MFVFTAVSTSLPPTSKKHKTWNMCKIPLHLRKIILSHLKSLFNEKEKSKARDYSITGALPPSAGGHVAGTPLNLRDNSHS